MSGKRPDRPATSVQIISILCYAGFAISVSIVAITMFGLVGLVLPVLFAWQWGRIPALGGDPAQDPLEPLRPATPAPKADTGNGSFDAYRDDLLARLETEQAEFEGFLGRLREARDETEFDRYLEERARAGRASGMPPA